MAVDPFANPRQRHHQLAQVSRRSFLLLCGGVGALGATVFGGVQLLKFIFPNTTAEAPLKFKATVHANDITVDRPYMDYAHRTGIIRDDAGFYAVELVCTHLGCTPNYVTNVTSGSGVSDAIAKARGVRKPSEQIPNGWACPCHGSRYFIDSTNFYGPAPRPMDWYDIQFAPDGYFVVDRGNLVALRRPGETTSPLWRLDPRTKKDNGKTYGV